MLSLGPSLIYCGNYFIISGLFLEKLCWKFPSNSDVPKFSAFSPSPKPLLQAVEGRDWICCLFFELKIVLLPFILSFKDFGANLDWQGQTHFLFL